MDLLRHRIEGTGVVGLETLAQAPARYIARSVMSIFRLRRRPKRKKEEEEEEEDTGGWGRRLRDRSDISVDYTTTTFKIK